MTPSLGIGGGGTWGRAVRPDTENSLARVERLRSLRCAIE